MVRSSCSKTCSDSTRIHRASCGNTQNSARTLNKPSEITQPTSGHADSPAKKMSIRSGQDPKPDKSEFTAEAQRTFYLLLCVSAVNNVQHASKILRRTANEQRHIKG